MRGGGAMSDFDKQIRERKMQDRLHMHRAMNSITGAVNREKIYDSGMDLNADSDAGLYDICRYFGMSDKELPSDLTGIEDKMNYLFESRGVMRRRIMLDGEWWKNMDGPVLCRRVSDGLYMAFLQDSLGRYYTIDRKKNRKVRMSSAYVSSLHPEALCFYRPLPEKKLTAVDMMKYALSCPKISDWIIVIMCMLLVTVIGMITPRVTQMLFSSVIPAGSELRLMTTAVLLISIAVGLYFLNVFSSIYNARITQKVSFGLSAATFSRMLSMPAEFFKDSGTGDMASRVSAVQTLGTTLMSAVLSSGLTTVFSLIYIVQIFNIAPGMIWPALAAIAMQFAVSILLVLSQRRLQHRTVKANAALSGTVFSLFSGMQKIKLAGAEERAFHRWADSYQEKAKALYAPPRSLIVLSVLMPVVSILGSAIIYAVGAGKLTLADYMAFNTAYGMAASAIMGFSSLAGKLAGVGPTLELARPLLETEPETAGEREAIHEISGRIDVSNLSFRYTEDGPWVIDGLDLSIEPGSYVAIVGTTGCGKSTLLRLLLGFETPQVGSVFYDGKDISRVDIRSLRRLIGTVLQDGKLFQSSIFGNIIITSPEKTLDVAWEAAEAAQIADDIRAMPMGMHTDLSGSGISGGQRQRVLIARAIAPKPRVLIFDEATSALDNVTQAKVSEALDKMDCTRIVVAHRLSTIRNCHRIIVLDNGKIIEDGNYDELMKKNGFFADLVARQRPE